MRCFGLHGRRVRVCTDHQEPTTCFPIEIPESCPKASQEDCLHMLWIKELLKCQYSFFMVWSESPTPLQLVPVTRISKTKLTERVGDQIREARSEEKFEERSRRYGWSGVTDRDGISYRRQSRWWCVSRVAGWRDHRSPKRAVGIRSFHEADWVWGYGGGGKLRHPERRDVGQQGWEVRMQAPSELGAGIQTRRSLNLTAMVAGSSICKFVTP